MSRSNRGTAHTWHYWRGAASRRRAAAIAIHLSAITALASCGGGGASAKTPPTPTVMAADRGTVFVTDIESSDPSAHTETDGVVAVDPVGGSQHPLALTAHAGLSLLTVPAGDPNVGTVFAYDLKGYVWRIGPDLSVTPYYVGHAGMPIPDPTASYDGGGGPDDLLQAEVVAPPGTPNAGTAYFVDAANADVLVVAPNGAAHDVKIPGAGTNELDSVVVAPAGTPQSGALYLPRDIDPNSPGSAGVIYMLNPTGRVSQLTIPGNPNLSGSFAVAVAPSGPAAGTVYAVEDGSHGSPGQVAIFSPHSSTPKNLVSIPGGAQSPTVAGGTGQNAGDLYFAAGSFYNGGMLDSLDPKGTLTGLATFDAGTFGDFTSSAADPGTLYAVRSAGQQLIVQPDGTTQPQAAPGVTLSGVYVFVPATKTEPASTLFAQSFNVANSKSDWHSQLVTTSGQPLNAFPQAAYGTDFDLDPPAGAHPGTLYYLGYLGGTEGAAAGTSSLVTVAPGASANPGGGVTTVKLPFKAGVIGLVP